MSSEVELNYTIMNSGKAALHTLIRKTEGDDTVQSDREARKRGTEWLVRRSPLVMAAVLAGFCAVAGELR